MRHILDLSLLFACVVLNKSLAAQIIKFGRSLKYLLGISDETCCYMLSTRDTSLSLILKLLVNKKIVLHYQQLLRRTPRDLKVGNLS